MKDASSSSRRRVSGTSRMLVIVAVIVVYSLITAAVLLFGVGGSHRPSEKPPAARVVTAGVGGAPPRVPTASLAAGEEGVTRRRREAVVDAFRSSWKAYHRHAWGCDELLPLSDGCMFGSGLGLQIIDALDSAYLMGLTDEFALGTAWVAENYGEDEKFLSRGPTAPNQKRDDKVSFFETTIRALGGLLGAHDLSGDATFVWAASRLADRLLPAFEKSPSSFPFAYVNLRNGDTNNPHWLGGSVPLADATTCILEWSRLSNLTGDPRCHDEARAAHDAALELPHDANGFVVGHLIDHGSGGSLATTTTLGPLADSHYEYLLKYWLLSGKSEERYRQAFVDVVDGVIATMVSPRPGGGNASAAACSMRGSLLSETNVNGSELRRMDHLACFMPGVLALGVLHGAAKDAGAEARWRRLAEDTAEGCYRAFYEEQPSGLAPEVRLSLSRPRHRR